MVAIRGALPTHEPEKALDPLKVDVLNGAKTWLDKFGTACQQGDVGTVLDSFREDGFWRDMLPLTWSYRSLGGLDGGKDRIKKVLDERLAQADFKNFELDPNLPPSIEHPMPDLSFLQLFFRFENKAGKCSGIARLRPSKTRCKVWEAWTVSTLLESLHGVPERLDPDRPDTSAGSGEKTWLEQRQEQLEYKDREPDVLLIGAGQSGLCMAARLGVLGVDVRPLAVCAPIV